MLLAEQGCTQKYIEEIKEIIDTKEYYKTI